MVGTAQEYNFGIGIRGGFPNGITAKGMIPFKKIGIEGVFGDRGNGKNSLMLMAEFHNKFAPNRMEGMFWYFGAGPHLGFSTKKDYADSGTDYGLIFVGGFEFQFPRAPFVMGIDYIPMLNFRDEVLDHNGGAFFRYVFK